jgi:hypothetical protein
MNITENSLKTLLKTFLICTLLLPFLVSAEETSESRPTKEYPLKPRHKYTGDKDPHCELWSLERLLGKAATCRRRAKKPSDSPITCRFKRSYKNKDDPELTMCVYEKAGYNLEELTISSETYVCEKEFKCKK